MLSGKDAKPEIVLRLEIDSHSNHNQCSSLNSLHFLGCDYCNKEGTASCDEETGSCVCKEGWGGSLINFHFDPNGGECQIGKENRRSCLLFRIK